MSCSKTIKPCRFFKLGSHNADVDAKNQRKPFNSNIFSHTEIVALQLRRQYLELQKLQNRLSFLTFEKFHCSVLIKTWFRTLSGLWLISKDNVKGKKKGVSEFLFPCFFEIFKQVIMWKKWGMLSYITKFISFFVINKFL